VTAPRELLCFFSSLSFTISGRVLSSAPPPLCATAVCDLLADNQRYDWTPAPCLIEPSHANGHGGDWDSENTIKCHRPPRLHRNVLCLPVVSVCTPGSSRGIVRFRRGRCGRDGTRRAGSYRSSLCTGTSMHIGLRMHSMFDALRDGLPTPVFGLKRRRYPL
jgi:hypothetical protein